MLVIGENIHVISKQVREAIESRNTAFIQDLALRQVKAGANVVDLNIGPQKRAGAEVMSWMVSAIQEVVDVPLSLDTTNAAAIEAGLKLVRQPAFINSTDATTDRLQTLMPLAARYNARVVALTYAGGGLPTTADERIQLAVENILPAAAEHGVPADNIFFDPLVLTINGNQDQAQQTVNAVRFFKQMSDPPPMTVCGLSNVSNSAPRELRPLINRVFLLMMLGAGLDSAIIDPLDEEIMEAVRTVEKRDASTARRRMYLALYDAYAAAEPFDPSILDPNDPEQVDFGKTVDVLENKWLYAHSYLRV